MKLLLFLFLIALTALTSTSSEKITSSQKEKILQKLEKFLDKEEATRAKKAQSALKDFLSASNSPESALKLYLKCLEQTNFIKNGKKSSDFRKWKHGRKELLNDPNFSTTLQIQLKWLCILLGASQSDVEMKDLAAKSRSFMHVTHQNLGMFKDHRVTMGENCLASIFAKSYKISNINRKRIPRCVLLTENLYARFILPPLKKEKRPAELRAAMLEMIDYKMKRILVWPPRKRVLTVGQTRKLKESLSRSPKKSLGLRNKSLKKQRTRGEIALEKFKAEELPQLMWNIEKAVYDAGDEIGSSHRMMKQIMQFSSDTRVKPWIKDLHQLLNKDSTQS